MNNKGTNKVDKCKYYIGRNQNLLFLLAREWLIFSTERISMGLPATYLIIDWLILQL